MSAAGNTMTGEPILEDIQACRSDWPAAVRRRRYPDYALLKFCATCSQLMTLKNAAIYSARRFWYLR